MTTKLHEIQHPEWMSEEALETLAGGYLLPGETVRMMWERVADQAEKLLGKTNLASDIFTILWNGWLGLASPILSNFGTNRGLPISCYSLHVDDSLSSIFSHLKESAALSRNGGGVGVYLGDIRHSGTKFGDNGISSGVLPWAQLYDNSAGSVSQGGVRRGNFAIYIPIDHPDLPELLRAKDHSKGDPRNFIDSNLAVTISDDWINSMLSGDEDKKELFGEVLKTSLISGSPYIVFIDNVNKANPDCYKERGLKVSTSNLCFPAGTEVMTSGGFLPIETLAERGSDFQVVSAKWEPPIGRWSEIKPAKAFVTSEYEQLVRVNLAGGGYFRCTPEHKICNVAGDWFPAKESLGQKLSPLFFHKCAEDYEVVSVEYEEGGEKVYDLTVKDNHNFYIKVSDSEYDCVLVHNCSEITLHTDENHTFVCCLSSLNLAKYSEWCDWVGPDSGLTVVELSIYLLEAVISEFLKKTQGKWGMGRARRFAEKSRALGLGVLGYHHYLQSLGLPFESPKARGVNIGIHRKIKEEAVRASKKLAQEFGEPEWCRGSGMRHTHLLAIAPTKTNSVICGSLSQGIEPMDSNLFSANQSKGTFTRKNPLLQEFLKKRGKDTEEVWDSILENQGSVQHLSFLSQEEKNVFKTAREINQRELIKQACDRQEYVCQSQSLNLFLDPDISAEELMEIHLAGWANGLKSRYYVKSVSPLKKVDRYLVTKDGCPYCELLKRKLMSEGKSYSELTLQESVKMGLWNPSHGTFPQLWEDGVFKGGYSENSGDCEACEA